MISSLDRPPGTSLQDFPLVSPSLRPPTNSQEAQKETRRGYVGCAITPFLWCFPFAWRINCHPSRFVSAKTQRMLPQGVRFPALIDDTSTAGPSAPDPNYLPSVGFHRAIHGQLLTTNVRYRKVSPVCFLHSWIIQSPVFILDDPLTSWRAHQRIRSEVVATCLARPYWELTTAHL